MDPGVLLFHLLLIFMQETGAMLFLADEISSSYFLRILGTNYFNISLLIVYVHVEIHLYSSVVLSTNT